MPDVDADGGVEQAMAEGELELEVLHCRDQHHVHVPVSFHAMAFQSPKPISNRFSPKTISPRARRCSSVSL
jgi:hypothetical protein